ncbi:MAG: UDP-N-acetylglucosamine 1-carboxyvinyltransferase [Clostridia bacterium]|nr:UDP-N-acetylglucosamine 1-carboxyvinyltransferase [Clostridia bacterium]MCI9085110.1 UDP-N-acetylglucosamine 1-carboxyvinyltransferase [Clostridia bacterium]NDO19527.1 UDP-N-acetylglucosamine 1-carboxyvinyltransferase [Lachnospiraceae bacterium MD329]
MGKLIIDGGKTVSGEICVQGAKNAVLPILAATVMADGESVIKNCPRLRDVDKTTLVLERLGCGVKREGDAVIVDTRDMHDCEICEDLMREMRSSIIFLGAIISRCKRAVVSMPGGCPIGLRPIDLHLKALRQMGVEIREEHGYIKCSAPRLTGGNIHLDFPSVGATENIMLAGVCASGTTTISNAAREPEIVDLGNFLNKMGANVRGMGTSVITIEGVEKLESVEYTIMPDRIVAATYLAASAITGGEICLTKVNPQDMGAMLYVLSEMGVRLHCERDRIIQTAPERLKSVHTVRTMPYPGFPTDIQSPFMSLAAMAQGTSVFIETIFENRFQHIDELSRMGADIKVEGRSAVVRGVNSLEGANVVARELRGGAALVVAALAASGTTTIGGTEFIDRGYENIEKYLTSCGAKIRRE